MKLKYVIIRDVPAEYLEESYEASDPEGIIEEEQAYLDQGIYSYDELFEDCKVTVTLED
jgi:hypothetical protein